MYLATLGATVIAGWWITNVAAWAVALRRGISLDRFTLPGTKRIAQLMVAVTLSSSCVADATNDPVMVLVEQAEPAITTSSTIADTTAPTLPSAPTTIEPTPTAVLPTVVNQAPTERYQPPAADEAADDTDPRQIAEHQVVVHEGDNLWSLATDALRLNGVSSPTTGQIAEYWRLVVASNQVRSGNPDLIVPGEAINMPAFDLSSFGAAATNVSQPSQPGGIAIR